MSIRKNLSQMARHRCYILFLFSLAFLGFASVSHSDGEKEEGLLNRLLAPGPLIQGHHELEGNDCLKCHDAGKGVVDEKCLECHTKIRTYVDAQQGFHGGLSSKTCIECHSDHKGRGFDSMSLDPKTFNHRSTGFDLLGKHEKLKCQECHVDKRGHDSSKPGEIRYFGKRATCISCHKKEDVHFFSGTWAQKDCSTCHGSLSWKTEIRFNHTKDTKFKLEGHHQQMMCAECHVPDLKKTRGVWQLNGKNYSSKYHWEGLSKSECLACHQDIHKKNLSPKFQNGRCTECHSQAEWKLEKFDHSVTRYPLRGKHLEIRCTDCHKQDPQVQRLGQKNFKWTGLKSDCLSCHKDFHRYGKATSHRYGSLNQCLSCHNESKWDDIHNFNHSVHTHFPVDGLHIDLKCQDCHNRDFPLPVKKQNGTKAEPTAKKTSSGGEIQYPIKAGVYHWQNLSSKTCEVCHSSPHKNSYSKEFSTKRCNQCHVTTGWFMKPQNGKFDHAKTRFALTGAHKILECSGCHVVNRKQQYNFKTVEQKFCIDCHKNPHTSQFGQKLGSNNACYECHTTDKWTDRLPFDHNTTRFQLKGEHGKVKCEDCHTPVTGQFFETRPPHPKSKFLFPELAKKECTTCHEDIHKGQLGASCSKCHNENSWKKTTFRHNVDSTYKLNGKHAELKCGECHKPRSQDFVQWKKEQKRVIHYKPIDAACNTCHKDVHKGNFGNKCQECHSESAWKLTKDFHKNFSLTGIHYSLACAECHKDGRRLSGMSDQCMLCHQKDDIHNGSLPNCKQCHQQQFWENADFKHSFSRFPLKGAHRTLDCYSCHSRGIYQGTPNRCQDCHLNDAQSATRLNHSPITNFLNCGSCHNTFSF